MSVGIGEETRLTVEGFKEATAKGVDGKEAVAALAERFSVTRDTIRSRLRRQGLWGELDFDKGIGRRSIGIHNADYKADRLIPPNPPYIVIPANGAESVLTLAARAARRVWGLCCDGGRPSGEVGRSPA
jgi:hypothetical protein